MSSWIMNESWVFLHSTSFIFFQRVKKILFCSLIVWFLRSCISNPASLRHAAPGSAHVTAVLVLHRWILRSMESRWACIWSWEITERRSSWRRTRILRSVWLTVSSPVSPVMFCCGFHHTLSVSVSDEGSRSSLHLSDPHRCPRRVRDDRVSLQHHVLLQPPQKAPQEASAFRHASARGGQFLLRRERKPRSRFPKGRVTFGCKVNSSYCTFTCPEMSEVVWSV